MTRTPDLIDALVEPATPVRRLRPPMVRAGLWLALFRQLHESGLPVAGARRQAGARLDFSTGS